MRQVWFAVGLLVAAGTASAESDAPLVERVLSRQEQEALTPNEVLVLLKRGNQRFVSGNLTSRDHSALVRDAASGQFPKAIILSCVDSRVPAEDVFDRGIGDVFVARVAGKTGSNEAAHQTQGIS